MKKVNTFISYKIILVFALFFSDVIIVYSESTPPPPPPPGLETPPPVSIDLYLIPMILTGIIVAFFSIRKNTIFKEQN